MVEDDRAFVVDRATPGGAAVFDGEVPEGKPGAGEDAEGFLMATAEPGFCGFIGAEASVPDRFGWWKPASTTRARRRWSSGVT